MHLLATLGLALLFVEGSVAASIDLPGIIGNDDRRPLNTAQWPWSAIGRVNQQGGITHCSGVLIDENKVLTAAHCLFDAKTKKWLPPEEIVFVPDFRPGFDYDFAKGSAYVHEAQNVPAQVDFGFIAHDWAVLTLEKPMSQRPVPVRVLSAEWAGDLGAVKLQTGGYSMDRPYMLSVDYACKIRQKAMDDAVLVTDCDITKGNSGSPILVQAQPEAWYVVGVFSSASEAGTTNMATFAVGAKAFFGRY